MFKPLIALYSSILLTTTVFAQQSEGYRVQYYTTENGMPSNGIKGLKWDETTGFLWIATEAGVVRFNGLDLTIFNKDNTPGLAHERIAYLVKNDAGSIFAADANENIFKIVSNSLQLYKRKSSSNVSISLKRLDLAVTNTVLQKKIFAGLEQSHANVLAKILQPDDSSSIIIDERNRFYYTSPGSPAVVLLTMPGHITSAMMIGQKAFFVDKEKRIYTSVDRFKTFQEIKILNTDGKAIRLEAGKSVLIWEKGMKNPILFSGNNAWLLRDKHPYIEATLICSAIPSFSYIQYAQYSERNKMLFIGTDSKGIIVINENRVFPMKQKETDISVRNAYYSQVELRDGNVLTNEGHIIGPSSGSVPPIINKFNFTVYANGDSLLWYAQFNKQYTYLHEYNYRTKQTKLYTKIPIVEKFALSIAEKGAIYVATERGLGVFQQDSIKLIFPSRNILGSDSGPFNIVELTQGVFVVASCDGLIRYNTLTNSVDTILKIPGYCIRTIWKYKDYLFIGSYGQGYYVYKNGSLKAMPLDKNRYMLYTHCFVPDEFGFCWISTNRGLFKAQLADIITAFEKNTSQVYYHYFGKNDGMEITEMNGGCAPCALIMKSKIISFPTMDGLLWVDPAKANPLLPEGDIYIDEFTTGKNKVDLVMLNQKSLPSRPGDIIIKISFSAWCNKENVYLDYKLNNNDQWISIDVARGAEIKLSNLSSGNYTLTLRKINGFGTGNYSYKEINFSIRTPWNKQWWFYLIVIFVIGGMIALYLKLRTKQFILQQRKLERQVAQKTIELKEQNEVLEKNNSIKTRLISIISHDIVTPLKFLTVAGNNLIDNKDKMPEDLQQETIREMANTSQELQLLSTNILNWIKYQNENRRLTKEVFNMNEMVRQVLGILNTLARQKNLHIVNAIDKEITIYQYYEPMKILVYNLLTNAINFSEKGTITVSAETITGNTIVSVQDEGVGMTPEKKQSLMEDHVVISSANVDNRKGHGLGFLIIKDLLSMMGATLSIESTKGVGSRISVFIPV